MTRPYRLGLMAFVICTVAHAAPYCHIGKDRIELGNRGVRREWTRQGKAWMTSRLERGDGREAVPVTASEEFAVRLYEGETYFGSSFVSGPPKTSRNRDDVSLQFPLSHSGMRATVRYWLRGDQPWMRKSVTITAPKGVVDEIEVEHFATGASATRGGYGQPIFLANAWFLGLEYPAGYNDVRDGRTLVLHHYPGREARAGLTSKVAVLGVTPAGLTRELAFSDYLDSIRIQTRNFLQYNSWYDLQGGNLTIPNVLRSFGQFRAHLLVPYGLKMDAFVPDDGWQDPNSIWQPDKARYRDGFRPLAEELERQGSRLGIWMPLNGTNLNIDWGRGQGFEVASPGGYYCIVGPKYNAEIRRVTAQRIRDGNLAYYKHDFNGLQCSAAGHGHLPTARHGHEASLDAEIDLIAWERRVNPDIFLNITSSVWLSPWWLRYADSIWMCASDFGYDKTYPQLSPREWDMSYRDAHFHTVYRKQGNLVPLSALMTHGIIHGQLCKLGGDQETVREFSDMTVLYYGRGVQLKELYITPDLMDEARWRILGQATRWAVDNAPILRNTVMIGGDPRPGEPYGYVHWQGERGIVVLRNPASGAAAIEVPFNQSVYYRKAVGKRFAARIIYPYHGAAEPWRSGRTQPVLVPGCSVMVIDLRRGEASALKPAAPRPPLATDVKTALASDAPGFDLTFTLPEERRSLSELRLTVRGSSTTGFTSLTINGAAARSRQAEGPSWRMQALDLKPYAGKTVTVAARLPRAEDRPFSISKCPVEAWLVADRPTTDRTPAKYTAHLPFPIGQNYRRDSLRLLDMSIATEARAPVHVSDEELAGVTAARLRLEVFDSNAEPRYAEKWITLNGQRLARVPANRGELSAWEEQFVDLTPEQIRALRRSNTITLGNAGGDCYKFGGLGLALRKPDGKWVTTAVDERVYSSVDDWLYSEGTIFGDVSPEVTIAIP